MIEFKNVSLYFKDRKLFENLSFSYTNPTSICFVGKSGTGKSSLFNLLMGFIKPNKGNIFLLNKKFSKENLHEIRKNIAWLPQGGFLPQGSSEIIINSFMYIFQFSQNIHLAPNEKELKIYIKNINNKEKKIKESSSLLIQLDKYLEIFNLEKKILLQNISQISGGEKQRLGIILTLLLNRKILLLDEPTSALDKQNKDIAIKLLLKNIKSPQLILSISHDKDWINKNKHIILLD